MLWKIETWWEAIFGPGPSGFKLCGLIKCFLHIVYFWRLWRGDHMRAKCWFHWTTLWSPARLQSCTSWLVVADVVQLSGLWGSASGLLSAWLTWSPAIVLSMYWQMWPVLPNFHYRCFQGSVSDRREVQNRSPLWWTVWFNKGSRSNKNGLFRRLWMFFLVKLISDFLCRFPDHPASTCKTWKLHFL